MGKIKVTILMEEELYEDITDVVSDGYGYGFQSRGHLLSVAADELLRDRGYYEDDEDEEDEEDDDEELVLVEISDEVEELLDE